MPNPFTAALARLDLGPEPDPADAWLAAQSLADIDRLPVPPTLTVADAAALTAEAACVAAMAHDAMIAADAALTRRTRRAWDEYLSAWRVLVGSVEDAAAWLDDAHKVAAA